MEPCDADQRLGEAAEEFNRHEKRDDGSKVAACLSNGLAILRDSVYRRVHQDVERVVGIDSMLMPVSEVKTQLLTTKEIEVYQMAESAAGARQLGYVSGADGWFLEWVSRLRLGEQGRDAAMLEQLRRYAAMAPDARRLAFADRLARILPESRQAPLVMFRLVPLAAQIATALAFGDRPTAEDLRRQQATLLPAIADCHACHGRVLECLEQCAACGNPLWKYEWLVAVD